MASIKDVATMAEVSPTTVSRVFNDTGQVKESTRSRVIAVAEQLGYRPNPLAQSLRTRKTNTIGVMLPDLTSPFFPELLRGIEEVANAEGFHLVVSSSDEAEEKEVRNLDVLADRWIDGIILSSVQQSVRLLREFQERHGIPVVLIDRVIDRGFHSVCIDNFKAAYQAVEHLAELGHRKIAYIAGPASVSVMRERLEGYRQALDDRGLHRSEKLIEEGNLRIGGGFAATERLLSIVPRSTAILAGNDLMALGAVKALKRTGFRIPEDFAVMGFDNIQVSAVMDPPLTTVAQPTRQMGAEAVRLFLDVLENPTRRRKRVVLPATLIVRQSTDPRAAESDDLETLAL